MGSLKMKKLLFGFILTIILILFLSSDARWKDNSGNDQDVYSSIAGPKAFQWVKTFGGTGMDRSPVKNAVQGTIDGGYILSGATTSFGAGSYDVWVLKLDSSGEIEWQKTYGGIETDGGGILETRDGGYIISGITLSFGAGDKDIWLVKLTSFGDIEWQKTYGGSEEDEGGIQETSDGGYIIFGGTRSFGAGDEDCWILKLNSTGDIEWQKTYGGNKYDCISSILHTSDGGYFVTGVTESFGVGGLDGWALKLTSFGDIEWQKTFGGDKYDYLASILQTKDGGYVVTGETESYGAGHSDCWVLKLTSEGDIEWQRAYGGNKDEFPNSIHQTKDGGYVLSGGTNSFGAGGTDGWILKLTSKGKIRWQKTFGGYEGEWNSTIHQTGDGGFILAGVIDEPHSSGDDDIMFLKLTRSGNIPDCFIIGSSNASVSDTSVSPLDTSVIPMDTNILPQDTNVLPQESNATTKLICTASVTLPKAPKRLKANAISWKRIKLRWVDKSKNEKGFFIERRSDPEETWEVVKKVKRNTKRCYDKGLKADTIYYYRVCAFDKYGCSPYSNITKIKTKKR